MCFDQSIVNIRELNKEFDIYDSIMQKLFNKNDMRYTCSNFHALIPHNALFTISENTFYRNRQKMENDFSSYFCNPNVMFNKYYIRLKNYLFSVSNYSDKKKDTDSLLSCLKVTKNFFPLYIGLIVSYSKMNDWNKMTENIKESYKRFFPEQRKLYDSLLLSEAETYYNHWLDLLLPQNLYNLINEINTIIHKEKSYISYEGLRYNLNLFMDTIVNFSFKTNIMQNKFLSYATKLIADFKGNRKQGLIFLDTSNDTQNKIKKPKMYIGDELLTEEIYKSLLNYKLLEDELYSQHSKQKQE